MHTRLRLGLYHLEDVENPTRILGLDHQEYYTGKVDAVGLWGKINNAMQLIMTDQYANVNFEELYRAGYDLVLHKHGANLYNGLKESITFHVTNHVRGQILNNLNSEFLKSVNDQWNRHQEYMSMIGDILGYMDRVYVNLNRLDDIYTLGINVFRDQVIYYEGINKHLSLTLLDMVNKERLGQGVDRAGLKSATEMLMVLGNKTPNVYQAIFEHAFLENSKVFFKMESDAILQNNDASMYLRRVDKRIFEEIQRSECCFDEITMPQIIKVAEDELITARMGVVVEMDNSGLVHMMQNQMTEDLACMYKVLGRVPDGLKVMFDCISCYIREQGKALVKDDNNRPNSNAINYVQNLLDLKDKVDFYLIHSFSNDKLCQQIIASDFAYILNLNSKSPEYLSLFIDDKLKKSRVKTNGDMLVLINKTIVLFRFLQDKDMFEQYYKQHLAKRLINKPFNEDNEKRVLQLFQNECGLHYTRKMEGMFKDIWTSSNLKDQYSRYVAEHKQPVTMDFNLKVLTPVHWPNAEHPEHPCQLPTGPSVAFQTFKEFYLSRHCGRGRNLTLLPQLGTAEVYVTPKNGPPEMQTNPYTLVLSTYQMCIIMLFNERPRWTFEEMTSRVTLSAKELRRSVHPLVMGKSSHKLLTRNDEYFHLNTSFVAKSAVVKVPPYQKKYEDEEMQKIIKEVNEGRSKELEAAIIRTMKLNQVMTHKDLVNEVISRLRARFVPSNDRVKTRIEDLIDREYLERSADDRQVYKYVPSWKD